MHAAMQEEFDALLSNKCIGRLQNTGVEQCMQFSIPEKEVVWRQHQDEDGAWRTIHTIFTVTFCLDFSFTSSIADVSPH